MGKKSEVSMLILKTNPIHNLYINFFENDGEIYIKTISKPSMVVKHFYHGKDYNFEFHISDNGPQIYDEYIVPMLILLKKLFPDKTYNFDAWIKKCESQSYHFNAYKGKQRQAIRNSRFRNYEYILYDNELTSDVIDKINSKLEKLKTCLRVKGVVEDYKKFMELKEKFGCEQ